MKIDENENNFNGKIIVYHSKEDNVISYKDSLILCNKDYLGKGDENYNNINIDLKIYEKGNHSMEELLNEPENILKNDILGLLNNDKEISDDNDRLFNEYDGDFIREISNNDNDNELKNKLLIDEKI